MLWAGSCKQSPLVSEIISAPGNPGLAELGRCVAIAGRPTPPNSPHSPCASRSNSSSSARKRPRPQGSPMRLQQVGVPCFGPSQSGGGTRSLQGLHEGVLRAPRHADRGLQSLRRRHPRQSLSRRPRAAVRDQGRRPGRPAKASSSPKPGAKPTRRSTKFCSCASSAPPASASSSKISCPARKPASLRSATATPPCRWRRARSQARL